MANKKVITIASLVHHMAALCDTDIEAEMEAQNVILETVGKLAKIGATAKEIKPHNFNPEPEAAKDSTGEAFCNEVRRRIEATYTEAGLSSIPAKAESMLCTNEGIKEEYDKLSDDSPADTMLSMRGVERIKEKVIEGKFSPVISTKALMSAIISALKVEEHTWESTVFSIEIVESEREGSEPTIPDEEEQPLALPESSIDKIEEEIEQEDSTVAKLEQALGGKVRHGNSAQSAADKLAQALGVSVPTVSSQEVVEKDTKVEQEVEQLLDDAIGEAHEPTIPSSIDERTCRRAITRYIRCNPGSVSQTLGIEYDPESEFPAEVEANWTFSHGTLFKCKGVEGIVAKVKHDGLTITGITLEKV
jgi:hypothetical protein